MIDEAVRQGKRVVSLQGGSRSGKTRNTCMYLVIYLWNNPKTRVSIVRSTLPAIKKSVVYDVMEVLDMLNIRDAIDYSKTEMIMRFPNDSMIEFFSVDDSQKIRGAKRDVLFINEANELQFEEFTQLMMRTTKFAILDYNPSYSDDHWLCAVNQDVKTKHYITTYRDNPFIEQTVIDEIEGLKNKNKALYDIYSLGIQSLAEGLIFPKITLIDFFPSKCTKVCVAVDYGFSCFTGDTLITTDKGDVCIKDIKVGDMVLTRKGYRKVLKPMYNGKKEVLRKNIALDYGYTEINATFGHNFNVNNKWKKFGELTEGETLYVLSSSTVESIKDTQVGNILTGISATKVEGQTDIKGGFIGMFGNFIMEKYRKAMMFTMSMAMRLIMKLTTYSLLLKANIAKYMVLSKTIMRNMELNTVKNTGIRQRTGLKGERKLMSPSRLKYGLVNGVAKNLHQQTHTRDFVEGSVTINGNTNPKKITKQECANFAVKSFKGTNTINQKPVQKNVCISSQSVKNIENKGSYIADVYDLWVEDVHEYFANGILVHNSDPTAIVKCGVIDNNLYLEELCYRTHMVTADVITELKKYSNYKIVSESADPRMIQELSNAGLFIVPVKKGAGSKDAGISYMQGLNIHVTKGSLNAIKEFRNYVYMTSSDGKQINQPIDAYDHIMDAARYFCINELMGKLRQAKVINKEDFGFF